MDDAVSGLNQFLDDVIDDVQELNLAARKDTLKVVILANPSWMTQLSDRVMGGFERVERGWALVENFEPHERGMNTTDKIATYTVPY